MALPTGSRCGWHGDDTTSGRCSTCDANVTVFGDPLSDGDIEKLVEAERGYRDGDRSIKQIMRVMERPRTVTERMIAAECRFVEEGHHVRLAGDGAHMLVTSDVLPRVTYRVGVSMVGETIVFTCDHICYDRRTGERIDGRQPARTFTPCKHGAGCARRLAREGLVRWDGSRWMPTDLALEVGRAATVTEDPWEGLPS